MLRGAGDQDPGRVTDALTMHPTASREQWVQDPLFQACLLLPPTQGVAVPAGMLVAHCSAPWGKGTLGAVPKQPGPGGVGVGGQLSALSWKWSPGPAADERHQSAAQTGVGHGHPHSQVGGLRKVMCKLPQAAASAASCTLGT